MASSRRQIALFRSLPILIITALAAGAISVIAWRTFRAVQRNTVSPAMVCEGRPLPEAPAYARVSGAHSIAAFRASDGSAWLPDTAGLAPDWLPEQGAFPELVLCISRADDLVLPACAGETDVIYGTAIRLTLLQASTATRLAETTLRSADPPEEPCLADPGSITVRPVSDLQIQAWVTPHVLVP